MSSPGQDGLQPRIEVVLHEYDALRSEIVSRTESRFGLVGFLVIAATILGATGVADSLRWVLIVIVLVLLAGIWVVFGLYIRRCAERLKEIEASINDQLGGDPVLTWESELSVSRFRRLIRLVT